MKDRNYYNKGLYAFTNEETLNALREAAKKENEPLYAVVDKAVRSYIESKYAVELPRPKKMVMIETA